MQPPLTRVSACRKALWPVYTAFLLALATVAPAGAQVVFVGNDVVDLKWNPPSGVELLYYKVLRDGAEIWRGTDPAGTFFRDTGDTGVAKGHTYVYKVCTVYLSTGDPNQREACSTSTVTTGHVAGSLYRDLTWSGDIYTLYGAVYVLPGVTLTINDSTVERDPETTGRVEITSAGGDLHIVKATLTDIPVGFLPVEFQSTGNSYLRSSTFRRGNNSIASVSLYQPVNIEIADTTFIGSTPLRSHDAYVKPGPPGARVVVTGSVFNDAGIDGYWASFLPSGADVIVTGNRFVGESGVDLRYATGTILDNVFVGSAEAGKRADVSAIAAAATATIERNIITRYWSAIGTSTGTSGHVTGNTLRDNYGGIGVTNAAVTVNDNCIAGNSSSGLAVPNDVPVDATRNWWGDPSGPRHPTNPLGKGDKLSGGNAVMFTPWLTTDNCREAPLPTPTATVPPTATLVPIPTHTPRPAALSVQTDAAQIIPNGTATANVTALLTTDQGQPVPDAQITFSLDPAGRGSFLPSNTCTTGADGRCSVFYRAPTPEDVFQQNADIGADLVLINAVGAGLTADPRPVQFEYMTVRSTIPANGEYNQDLIHKNQDGAQGVYVVFDRSIAPGSFGAGTFQVFSRRYFTGGSYLPCLHYYATAAEAHCVIDDVLYPNVDKGLVATAKLKAGPQGIRGQDGAMLKSTYTWGFNTLPKLQPRIIAVQVSESPSQSPDDSPEFKLVQDKSCVVRVHAGLDAQTELPWVEAAGSLRVDGLQTKPFVQRFMPGELGRVIDDAWSIPGNSYNWLCPYLDPDNQGNFIHKRGEHFLAADLTPTGQASQQPSVYSAYPTRVDVRPAPAFLYAWQPVAPRDYSAITPVYPWEPGATHVRINAEDPGAALQRLWPVQEGTIGFLNSRVVKSNASAEPPEAYPARVAREFDVLLSGRLRRDRQQIILVLPGGWLRPVNDNDSIWHGRATHTCVLGDDAPSEAVAHCFGHLYGLTDHQPYPLPPQPVMKGYDIERMRVVNSDYPDLPGYFMELMDSSLGRWPHRPHDVWIGVENYRVLLDQLWDKPLSLHVSAANTAGELLTIGGEVIRKNGSETGALDVASLPARGEPFPAPGGSGEFSLRLRGGSGAVLATYPFTPEFESMNSTLEYASFLFTLTAPAGIGVIDLLHGDQVLATRPVSANPPQVTVTQPTGGTQSGTVDVAWTATDPDGDTDLHFQVLYSSDDGATWQPVAYNPTERQVTLDTITLPSCQQCRIRVVGDDGVRTAEADSASFAVTNPPRVTGVRPQDGAVDVPRYGPVRVSFRDAMNADSLNASTFTLMDGAGRPVAGTVSYDAAAYTAVFTASPSLSYGGQYTARLDGSVRDAQGQALGAAYVWHFQLEGSPFCAGDCAGDRSVTVDELLTLVNLALGNASVFDCLVGDTNEDGVITVDEILYGVHMVLSGCPLPTPSPTAVITASPATATATPLPATATATPRPAASSTPSTTRPATLTPTVATPVPPTVTRTPTASATRTRSATLTVSPTRSATPSRTPTPTATATPWQGTSFVSTRRGPPVPRC